MKVVAWNMAHKPSNWDVLGQWDELKNLDIALLSEASPTPAGVVSVGVASTQGLEAALPPDKPVKRAWSAVDGVQITAISLYGLMDERSDASVHRSLSELSPIFDHDDYGKHLILGGDLNILAGRPKGDHLDRHQVVLARIKAYGLVDCLEQALLTRPESRGGLENCQCALGTGCTHTWTKLDPNRPTVPYQDDYLFASKALAKRLQTCEALPFTDDSPSDHTPIVATFSI